MNTQKTPITDNLDVASANALKRAGALIIDVILIFIVMAIFSYPVQPIINNIYDYEAKFVVYEHDMKKSNLVTLDAVLEADYSNIDEVNVVKGNVDIEFQAQATYKYYLIFLNSEITEEDDKYTDEWYIENILKVGTEDTIFERIPSSEPQGKKYSSVPPTSIEKETKFDDFVVEGLRYKEGTEFNNPAAINDFNSKIYADAMTNFTERPLYKELEAANTVTNILLIVIASSIILLALPLFLKHGQTPGKKMFKLGVTDKNGFKVGIITILLRYMAFMVINVLSNFIFPFIIPFISLTFMAFNKKGRSLHDFLAQTRVVDLNRSRIYDNGEDYQNHMIKVIDPRNEDNYNEEVFSERFDEKSGA